MTASYPAANSGSSRRESLFVACCVSLIVTAMSFAIRGALIGPLSDRFGLDKTQIGWIVGTAFWGFTLAIVIGGPLCDTVGMGRLLTLAFVGHLIGIFMTIFATGFWTLFFSTLAFGMGNGFVEAACNPLIATMYPDEKIKRLNRFHMWFPGGIVIGGLASYFIAQSGIGGVKITGHNWQIQMASMLLPLAIYGFLFIGKKFPATERVASGVSASDMLKDCFRPLFMIFLVCMLLTAATELGTGQWIPNILTITTGASGILLLVWQNGLMAVGRGFAGPIVHRLSPVAVLLGSATFSAIGLYLLSQATTPLAGWGAITVFAVGVCFFWPTMLGTVSERFPKTGSLGLALMGGAGMLASNFAQPVIGHKYDDITAQTARASVSQPALAKQLAALNVQALPAGASEDDLKAQKSYQDAYKAAQGKPDDATQSDLLSAAAKTPNAPKDITAAQNAALAAGGSAGLKTIVILPIILIFAFGAIFLYDKSRGGYKKETLSETALENAEMTPVNQA